MNNKNSSAAGSSISLSGLTFIAFLVLKLCGIIDWSWWWVTAPLWGPLALFLAGLIVYIIIILVIELVRYCVRKVKGRKHHGS